MSATGAVNIKLGAITTDFVNAMKGAAGAVKASVSSMNNDLAQFYKAQDRQRAVFSKGLGKLADDFQNVGRGLTTGILAPLALGAGVIAASYAGITQLKNAGEAYGITLADIQKIAKAPGLGLEEAASSVISLRSVKYDADLAKSAIVEFGNALSIAGKGKAELEGVSLAFQQIKSKGTIQAEEVNQIAERMPQIRDVLSNAFGTADTQQLQKMGIGANEFLTKVVDGLAKLPRAVVGPQIAWENFTDGLKIGAYEIGASADKLFGLTDKLNGLGDIIGNWAGKFKDLPEPVQKSIFLVAGLAAAIGPLLLGIGSVVKLLLVLAGGFGVVTGPVGIAVAVIAGAAALIIAHWDKIKVYWEAAKSTFMDSGVWTTFSGLVSSAFDLVVSIFKGGVSLITTIWNELKSFLIPQANFIFGTLTEIFKVGAGVLTGVFKVLTGIFTLDWTKLKEGLQNITVSLWNGIIGLTSKSIVYVGSLFAAFVEKMGATGFAESIRGGLDSITKASDKMKVALQGAAKAKDEVGNGIQLAEVTVLGKKPAAQIFDRTPKDGKGSSDTKSYWQKELDAVEKQILAFRDKYPGIEIPVFLRVREAEVKQNLGRGEKHDILGKEVGNIAPKSPLASLDPTQGLLKLNAKAATASIQEFSSATLDALAQLRDNISGALQSAAGSAAEGMGELIGGLMAGTASLASLPALFGNILGDLAQQIGRTMIAFGVSGIGLKSLMSNPATALVAGVGLVALGAALKSSMSKSIKAKAFANGGIVKGPTLGLVGEYASARTGNPEVISPLNSLKNILSPLISSTINQRFNENLRPGSYSGNLTQGGYLQTIQVMIQGQLAGSDIFLSGQRYQKSKINFG